MCKGRGQDHTSGPLRLACDGGHAAVSVIRSVLLGAGALLGDRVAGWLDPLVAAGMSVWLIWAWGAQCYANVMNLARPLPPPASLGLSL